MQAQKNYSKTPLKEAILDIGVTLPGNITISELELLQSRIGEGYADKYERRNITLESVNPLQLTLSGEQKLVGYEYQNINQGQILRNQLNSFSFIKLAPYNGWETFQPEAKRLWELYCSATNPSTIDRVALRYVSEFSLRLPMSDLKEFLTTLPEVSSEMPNSALSSYFMHLEMPQPDLKAMLVINQNMLPVTELTPKTISVVLDISLVRTEDIPNDNQELWELFEQLRFRKNEAFEACITDKTRKEIE